MEYPIRGLFVSKRGTKWHYTIYNDNTVEQYHNTLIRTAGGWKEGREVYAPKCTKELKEHIKKKYNINVR